MGIPEYMKNEITGLTRHEKSFDSKLGKERVIVYVPERFNVNEEYWNQFHPDLTPKPASNSNLLKDYKFVGKEVIHISYDLEIKLEQRPDLRELASCPHPNCIYCLQINQIKTQFENGFFRYIRVSDFLTFTAYANLIQATLYVDYGKAQISTYEENIEFMKSDVLNEHEIATVWSYGRKDLRTVKIFARIDNTKKENNGFARIFANITRYNIENWP